MWITVIAEKSLPFSGFVLAIVAGLLPVNSATKLPKKSGGMWEEAAGCWDRVLAEQGAAGHFVLLEPDAGGTTCP